jgi:DNA replication factor GINS
LYNDLYRIWKSEKTSEKTQPLPDDFYQRVQTYLIGLGEASTRSDEHNIQGRLAAREKEVAERLLQELKEVRLQKLLTLAQSRRDMNSIDLTEEERTLLKDLDKTLSMFEVDRKDLAVTERIELSVVRFLQDIPEIVGTDLKMYGPYKKEDVGSLPHENAQALIKQGAAKEIEIRNTQQAAKK